MNDNPDALRFDVAPDDSPIILGMNVKRFYFNNNVACPTYMSLHILGDKITRNIQTYLSGGDIDTRLILAILPTTLKKLIGKTSEMNF